jgi:hypothetical protein
VQIPQTVGSLNSELRKILPQGLDSDIFAVTAVTPKPSFLNDYVVVDQTSTPDAALPNTIRSSWTAPSIAIVDTTADVRSAAIQILQTSCGFSGRSPYAPAAVFVHEGVLSDFVFHLLQAAKSLPIFKEDSAEKTRTTPPLGTFDDARVLLASSRCMVLLCIDETGQQDEKPRKQTRTPHIDALPERREASATLRIHSSRGIEDMLDSALRLMPNHFDTLAAAFVFAGRQEASYISNMLNAEVTCVKTIPLELSVGPRYPRVRHRSCWHQKTDNLPPRYTREMFEVTKATVQALTEITRSAHDGLLSGTSVDRRELVHFADQVAQPLKSTGQSDGAHGDFFLRSLIVGAVAVVASTAGAVFAIRTLLLVAQVGVHSW